MGNESRPEQQPDPVTPGVPTRPDPGRPETRGGTREQIQNK